MRRDSTAYGAVRPAYDKNDCSIRALAVAVGCTYEQSSAMFSAAGRALGRGTQQEVTAKVHETWLKMPRIADAQQWTVAEFALMYPRGRYVLHRHEHAMAMIEGVLHDWRGTRGERSRIHKAWRVTEETLAKINATRAMFE